MSSTNTTCRTAAIVSPTSSYKGRTSGISWWGTLTPLNIREDQRRTRIPETRKCITMVRAPVRLSTSSNNIWLLVQSTRTLMSPMTLISNPLGKMILLLNAS